MKKRLNRAFSRKSTNFLNPLLTVDVVIFTVRNHTLETLLIRRAKPPFAGSPALPGGFLLTGENTRRAAERILEDKAGVSGVYMEQLYTFDDLDRDPRGPVFSVTYFALVPEKDIVISETRTTETPHFAPVHCLPKLAFDHNEIIQTARGRLRSKIGYTNAAFSLLPDNFTLAELHYTYEAILGRRLDRRNFNRKLRALNLITATGEKTLGGKHRPATLYQFTHRDLELLPEPLL